MKDTKNLYKIIDSLNPEWSGNLSRTIYIKVEIFDSGMFFITIYYKPFICFGKEEEKAQMWKTVAELAVVILLLAAES